LDDPQLELDAVKQQFLEAENHLRTLADEIRRAATARQALDEASGGLASASQDLQSTASRLAELSERLAGAAAAIEQAEPGAVRDRLAEVDAHVSELTDDVTSLRQDLDRLNTMTIASHQTQRLTSTLVGIVLAATVALGILIVVVR